MSLTGSEQTCVARVNDRLRTLCPKPPVPAHRHQHAMPFPGGEPFGPGTPDQKLHLETRSVAQHRVLANHLRRLATRESHQVQIAGDMVPDQNLRRHLRILPELIFRQKRHRVDTLGKTLSLARIV